MVSLPTSFSGQYTYQPVGVHNTTTATSISANWVVGIHNYSNSQIRLVIGSTNVIGTNIIAIGY